MANIARIEKVIELPSFNDRTVNTLYLVKPPGNFGFEIYHTGESSKEVYAVEPNPEAFVFDLVANGTPDVSNSGTHSVRFRTVGTNPGIRILRDKETVKARFTGRIRTRNVAGLVGSVTLGLISGFSRSLSTENFGAFRAGPFEFTIECYRDATLGLVRTSAMLEFDLGSEIKRFRECWDSATSSFMVNPRFSVFFAESNAANELVVTSGICEFYKANQ